jgi:hypothetical protein
MRYLIIFILSLQFSVSLCQDRIGRLTGKQILRNENLILELAAHMVQTKTTLIMLNRLDNGDVVKKKMQKLGIDFIRLNYLRDAPDQRDSILVFNRPLKDFTRDCGESILYDFSKYGMDYPDKKDEKTEFRRIKDRIYYRKNCNVYVLHG